ncbi:predicted protein [Uncinocarpus reesii 1704]|uniref:Uncharacterized protein n=1 Tax=Uncinocarpus reesii (strain UAMH 1704) TaxID=336963 RepID=C4JGY3_UNCRE|nr:uncharacterized protein UREG_01234 [Uncinocarpus reesii 1704]EEP76385.1 predicted protein [Uncinocarpus reesii 1704]
MYPNTKDSFAGINPEESASAVSAQATSEAGPSEEGARSQQHVAPDTVSSTSSLSDIDDDEDDDIRHTIFKTIKIHTAKCDVCNQHNKSTLRRCIDCGWQICTPCWDARGGNGTHGVSHKFTGPVFSPGGPNFASHGQDIAADDSDETISIPDDEVKRMKSKAKANIKGKKPNQQANHGVAKGRASERAPGDKGKSKAAGTKASQSKAAIRKSAKTISTKPGSNTTTKESPVVLDGNDAGTDDELESESAAQTAATSTQQPQAEMSPNDPNNPMFYLCMAAELASNQEKEQRLRDQALRLQAAQAMAARARIQTALTAGKARSPLFVPIGSSPDRLQGGTATAINEHSPLPQSMAHRTGPQTTFHQPSIPGSLQPPGIAGPASQTSVFKRSILQADAGENTTNREAPQPPPIAGPQDPRWTSGFTSSQRLRLDPESSWINSYTSSMWHGSFQQFSGPSGMDEEVEDEADSRSHGRPWDL